LNDYFPNELDFFLFPVPPCQQSTTDPSATICKPLNNSTVTSPANVVAGVNSSSPINSFSIWLDGKKVYSTPGLTLNTNVTMSAGGHQLIVQAMNGAKQVFGQTVNVTAGSTTGCQPSATVPSVNICAPANNATVSSPFTVQAASHMANAVNNSQIWLDGVKVYQVSGANVNTSVTTGAGSHRLTVQSVDTTGALIKQTVFVTVGTASCVLSSTDPSVTICTPAPNSTVTSPVKIVAGTTDSASTVTNTLVWVDGVKQWTASGGSLNTSLAMSTGTHRVTVQAKDSSGRYLQSTVNITVH
jgi:hypothetical protein